MFKSRAHCRIDFQRDVGRACDDSTAHVAREEIKFFVAEIVSRHEAEEHSAGRNFIRHAKGDFVSVEQILPVNSGLSNVGKHQLERHGLAVRIMIVMIQIDHQNFVRERFADKKRLRRAARRNWRVRHVARKNYLAFAGVDEVFVVEVVLPAEIDVAGVQVQVEVDAHFRAVVDEIKPVHADDDAFAREGVRRAGGDVADEIFFADGHGVVEAFGDENFFAVDVRANIRDNRIDNHAENFLRVGSQVAAIIVREGFAVANAVDDALRLRQSVKHGVGERNFPVGRDVGKFALEFVAVDFGGGSQSLQKFRRRGLMATVGEFTHFVHGAAQIIRMRLERQPQWLEAVEDACQSVEPVQ